MTRARVGAAGPGRFDPDRCSVDAGATTAMSGAEVERRPSDDDCCRYFPLHPSIALSPPFALLS